MKEGERGGGKGHEKQKNDEDAQENFTRTKMTQKSHATVFCLPSGAGTGPGMPFCLMGLGGPCATCAAVCWGTAASPLQTMFYPKSSNIDRA